MYEHEDLVHESFPKPASEATPVHLAGEVIKFPMSDNTRRIVKETAPVEPVPGVPTADIIPLVKKPK